MTDKPLMESLSALLDGEATELEVRRVLKSGTEEEVRTVWQRFQIAAALMRRDCHSPLEARQARSFASSVMAAIEAEEKGEPRVSPRETGARYMPGFMAGAGGGTLSHPWFAGVGKVAIAASVTLVMLLGLNQFALQEVRGTPASSELAAMGSADMNSVGTGSVEKYPGDTSAVVPEGYRVPELNAVTVSSVPGASASAYRSPVRSLNLPMTAQAGESTEINAELQVQLQRMLMLHSEKASQEIGLTIVPGSRLSSLDIPKE